MRNLLIFVLCISFGMVNAQVNVVSFEQFEKRLKTPSDTLVVYNFWATWCKPCVEELPNFQQFAEKYAGQKVKVVFVSLDFASQVKKVESFVGKRQIKSEVLLLNDQDYNKWIDKVSREWSGSIPATCIVYGPDAKRKFKEGSFTYPELEQFIKPLTN